MSFEDFVDKVVQLGEDQSLFEVEHCDDIHISLCNAGNNACEVFTEFCDLEKRHLDRVPHTSIVTLMNAVDEYHTLMLPPKMCGGWLGFLACFKTARSGPAYEKQLLQVHIHLVGAAFLAKNSILENHAEDANVSSIHFADYVNRANRIGTSLAAIQTGYRTSDQVRESSRNELISHSEHIYRFVSIYFEEEHVEFKQEALRRIGTTADILNARPTRQKLVKCQASLQEILNSVAGISSEKARDAVDMLEAVSCKLMQARELQVESLNDLEMQCSKQGLDTALFKVREDCELIFQDVDSKMRDALKRWKIVKSQSIYRPVVTYEENTNPHVTATATGLVKNGDDQANLLANTGQTILTGLALPGKAVKGGAHAVFEVAASGASGAKNIASSTVQNTTSMANFGASTAKNVGSFAVSMPGKAFQAVSNLGNDGPMPTTAPAPVKKTPKRGGFGTYIPVGQER